MGAEGQAVMTICQFRFDPAGLLPRPPLPRMVARVLVAFGIIGSVGHVGRTAARLDLLARVGGFGVPVEEPGDRLLLPREIARQGVEFRLALRG